MSEYAAFGRMERDSWAQSSRALKYVELFAAVPDQTIGALLDVVDTQAGHSALDVCCGQGNVSEALVARGCLVSGLDFSPAMLALARKRVPEARFVDGDAQNLPFQDGEFDVVVSNLGICHVPDQPRALAEACRVLRPGGRFAMTVWCGPNLSPCFGLIYEAVRTHGSAEVSMPEGPDFHQFANAETAACLFAEAGFSNVASSVIDCSMELYRPELLCTIFEKATVRAASMLASQPPERLSAIRTAIANAVRDRYGDGKRWRVPMPAALISARK